MLSTSHKCSAYAIISFAKKMEDFFSSTPQDITFNYINDEFHIETVTVPNLAKISQSVGDGDVVINNNGLTQEEVEELLEDYYTKTELNGTINTINAINVLVANLGVRITTTEQAIENIDTTINDINNSIDNLNSKIDINTTNIQTLNNKININEQNITSLTYRLDSLNIPELPENIVIDSNYVHTDNNYTNADKNKLSLAIKSDITGIPGAQPILNIIKISKDDYDNLTEKDPDTWYVVFEE